MLLGCRKSFFNKQMLFFAGRTYANKCLTSLLFACTQSPPLIYGKNTPRWGETCHLEVLLPAQGLLYEPYVVRFSVWPPGPTAWPYSSGLCMVALGGEGYLICFGEGAAPLSLSLIEIIWPQSDQTVSNMSRDTDTFSPLKCFQKHILVYGSASAEKDFGLMGSLFLHSDPIYT